MNKFLALIVLSASVVTASATDKASVNVTLPTKQGSAVEWVKAHKTAIIATAATALTVGAAAGTVYYFRDHENVAPYLASAKNGLDSATTAVVDGAVYAKDATVSGAVYVKDATVNGAVYAKDAVVAHPYITTGSVLGAVVLGLSIYDATRETEASYIKSVYKNLLAKAQAQDAKNAVAAN